MFDSITGFALALALVAACYGAIDPDGAAQIIRQVGRAFLPLMTMLPG